MTIRIFIGCAPDHEDAESQAVLEYSLRKYASEELELTWMKLSREKGSPFYSDPERGKGWVTRLWPTPFSAFRWIVPELAGYEGKAIYMDSDMIVLADIAELWHQEFEPGKLVLAKEGSWRFCVSLWDCAACKGITEPLETFRTRADAHRNMAARWSTEPLKSKIQRFEGNWNCLDGEAADLSDPDIKIVHYTSMPHQPHHQLAATRLSARGQKHWYNGAVSRHWRQDVIDLFEKNYQEAIAAGYTTDRYEKDPVFGHYRKQTLGNPKGEVPAWGR